MKEKNLKFYFYPRAEHLWDTQYKNIWFFFALIKNIFLQTLVEIIFNMGYQSTELLALFLY